MSLSLQELRKLHEKGLALIYLKPKTKRPFENGWTTQKPKSWDELENSFEKTYNVGVRLGEPSKLISGKYLGAIDCDVKSSSRKATQEMNVELRKLGIDLSAAPIVMSGRGNGSKHVYIQTVKPIPKGMKIATSGRLVKVKMPGETRAHSKAEMKGLSKEEREQGLRIRPAWEISLMGTGQQTVLPPSIHPDTDCKYAWASPLTVKYLPLFKPEKFIAARQEKDDMAYPSTPDFKAVEVDLWASKLHPNVIALIVDGKGCEDRSASLMAVAMSMCRAGFTDNEILSVLSDPNNYLSGAAYDRRHGRKSAVDWLYKHTLLKARYETSPMRYFDNPPTPVEKKPLTEEKMEEEAEKLDSDLNANLPDITKGGKPAVSLRNTVHILEHFMGAGLVGYDEFANRAIFLKDTIYGGIKGKELTDDDDLRLMHHIACHYRYEPSQDLCFKAHALIAKRYKFHPVREHLRSIEWDGKPRLDTWLLKAFSAQGPLEYIKAVSRKVLVAAVKRVFEPGCKFDYVMVLEGIQGKGKSMALGTLSGRDWFTDSLGDIHQKDVVDQMTGKWVIELAELSSIKRADIDTLKAFLSRQVDRVRPPYGRRSVDFPRQSIFIGSTNNSEYLPDETGNRRIWPVAIDEINQKWLKANRDQLWAEAVVRYELGEDVYLVPELEQIAAKEQEKRFDVDEWEVEIKKIITKTAGPYTTTQVWRAVHIDNGNGHPSDYDCKRISKIMRRLGFKKTSRRLEKGGEVCRCWT